MKNIRGFFYGLAIAVAMSATAATVYNYFPPPGMTYTPTTGLVVGTATGGGQGTGTVNAQGVFVNGTAVASSSAPGSNTQVVYNNSGAYAASSLLTFASGSVLLNIGAATTPGTFSVGQLDAMVINGVTVPIPGFALNSNIQGVFENHSYVNGVASGGARYYGVRSEGTISSPAIVVNGDHLSTFYAAGYNGTSYSLGGAILFQVNGTPGASAMPTDLLFQLSPAGSQTPATVMQLFHDGGTVLGSPTGGDQGAGTLNMQGCFVNGVACSTGGASGANPTGTVGLTAVNGVAGTYMRSDAAPPLSQAIVPTWTGTHTFAQSSPTQSILLKDTAAALNTKTTNLVSTGGFFSITGVTDAGANGTNLFVGTRTGSGWSAVSFGNATDNPTYTFLGTGLVTLQKGFVSAPAASAALMDFAGNGNTYQVTSFSVGQSSGGIAQLVQRANLDMQFWTNSVDRMVLNAAGGLTINAPSSGAGLSVTGLANSNTVSIAGASTASQSFGLSINAGTNSSDYALGITNQTGGTAFLTVKGDGGVTVGSPTGGSQGTGTVNANAFYESGNFVYREISWAGTCTSGGCTTGIAKGVGTAAVRNSAGNYTVTFSAAMGSGNAGCTASPWSTLNNGAISAEVSTANTTTVSVIVLSTSGTAVDSGFSVVCIG